jgi:threonine/homoserine/homoserine lactone efflux protein
MPSTSQFLTFGLLSFLLIVIPGPSALFVISRTLTLGRRAGVITVVGNATGEYLQVAAVAFGIGAIVEQSVTAFTVIKLTGAGYLIYLGIQAFRRRRSVTEALDGSYEPRTTRRMLRDGFVVGITNPKSVVFFTAVLPQFVNRSAGNVPIQLLILGAVFIAIALVGDSVWAMAAGTARSWLARSPRRLELIGGAGGLAMIGIGVGLAFSGRRD